MATDPMTGSTIVEYPDVESESGVLMVFAEYATYLAGQDAISSAFALSFEELMQRAMYAESGEVYSNLSIDTERYADATAEARAAYSVDSLMPDVGELGSAYEKIDIIHAIVINALLYVAANPDQFEYADDET